jgi:dihydroorotate dehydrogenase
MTLETRYLGLALSHPFMLGASPLTGHLDNVRRIEDGGCSALVMHSLFEEDVVQATAGRFPGLERALPDFLTSGGRFIVPERFPVGPHEYVEQLRRIKEAVSIPVIGSLNGVGGDGDGWLDYARLIEQAGADALELNVYFIAAGLLDSTVDIERHIEALVRGLKQTVRIPVAVKLLPFYTAFANVAARLTAAGADGLVLFNRFYEPDIDIERPSLLFNINPSRMRNCCCACIGRRFSSRGYMPQSRSLAECIRSRMACGRCSPERTASRWCPPSCSRDRVISAKWCRGSARGCRNTSTIRSTRFSGGPVSSTPGIRPTWSEKAICGCCSRGADE